MIFCNTYLSHYFIKGLQVQFHENVPLHSLRLEAGDNFISFLAADIIQYLIPNFKNNCMAVSTEAS